MVEDVEVEGTKMSWTVHSHQPLEAMEVQLRSDNEVSFIVVHSSKIAGTSMCPKRFSVVSAKPFLRD